MNALQTLINNGFEGTMDYAAYRKLIDTLHEAGKVTGPNQTPELLEYSKLNVHRMDRWDKHASFSDNTVQALQGLDKNLDILVITEGWCGDAAQIVPVIEKLSKLSNKIRTHYILRDENLEIMDMFLTNGKSRSIPIFVIIENGQVLGKFGPRPAPAQELIDQLKAENAGMDVIKEKLHLWYARDKHKAIEEEFVAVLTRLAETAM
jgi:thiol-disulfide isomerase/thioredoxin